jgi:hypothetical protein
LKRDLAELAELTRLAQDCSENPILALLDNTLVPPIGYQEQIEIAKAEPSMIEPYLDHLRQLQATQSALAGFVDRPRSTDLLALLSLIGWKQPYNRFRGLADRDLYSSLLPLHHRSALFRQRSPQIAPMDAANQAVYFFYLNPGEMNQIVRVEVPEWVAHHPHLIDVVHAGVVQECQGADGYPYTLIRAHELATVSNIEHRTLDQWIASVLIDQGLQPNLTLKATTKRWLGRPRQHTLSRSLS